ncbi:MAG: M48 family metalloprotease [Verrucomicrobia bacterium]|nr:M48 family metalloprotease [Verrucomicrobiota bacterium]
MIRVPLKRKSQWVVAALGLTTASITGCATNPVTGRNEWSFVSESQEIAVGKANYGFYQQAQGGTYRVEKSVTDYVRKVGNKLWAVSDRQQLPYEIVVLNSSVPNAWALPGGKMAINRGLLVEMSSEAELAAVLGHEMVHVAARHGAKSMQRGTFSQITLMGLGLWAGDEKYGDLILGGAGLTAGLVNLKYGRGAESESDKYGIKYMAAAGYDPMAAVELQETFLRISKGKNPGWLEGLFLSHPPSQERVEANRETASAYPTGGFVGREAYAQAMAPLFQSQEAYTALDNGYLALSEKNPERALELANQAIRMEPREAHFHGLAAKALMAQNKADHARREWDQAIKLDDNYFEYYLRRGQLAYQSKDSSAARRDLRKSVELLPTASGHYLLGVIALGDGNRSEATEHFRVAASSDSDEGKKAQVQLAKLELSEKPERYLRVGLGLNGKGYLVLGVENTTPVDISDCTVSVSTTASRRWESYQFTRGLPARRTSSLNTRIGPFADASALQQAGVQVRFDKVVVPDAE